MSVDECTSTRLEEETLKAQSIPMHLQLHYVVVQYHPVLANIPVYTPEYYGELHTGVQLYLTEGARDESEFQELRALSGKTLRIFSALFNLSSRLHNRFAKPTFRGTGAYCRRTRPSFHEKNPKFQLSSANHRSSRNTIACKKNRNPHMK